MRVFTVYHTEFLLAVTATVLAYAEAERYAVHPPNQPSRRRDYTAFKLLLFIIHEIFSLACNL